MEESEKKTYYIATEHGTVYFTHDVGRNEAVLRDGRKVTITEERLLNFLHTAELLGFKAGKI